MKDNRIDKEIGEILRGVLRANMITIKRLKKNSKKVLDELEKIDADLDEEQKGPYAMSRVYRKKLFEVEGCIRNYVGLLEDLRRNNLTLQAIHKVKIDELSEQEGGDDIHT